MASWLFSSLQTLSGKLLGAIRGSEGQESNETKPIEEDLKWLSRMLQRIEAVQEDAEEREIHDRSVELWLRELRGVAHEAEDVLDEFHYEVMKSTVENRDTANSVENTDTVNVTSAQNMNTVKATFSRGTKRRLEEIFTSSSLASSSSSAAKITIPDGMADTIKKIRERFAEICKARENLHLRAEDGERRILGPKCRPPSSSHIDEKGLFGRENEKEEIISLLNIENDTNFVVVPIVGKGGLGKTTLAQLVYNDPKVSQLFDKKAWVSVSDDFDLVRLTKATIESISDSPYLFSELSKLQDILKEKLSGIKLFLVLDDIWNEEKNLWESFKIVFAGAKTVRILITTRSRTSAKIMQTTSPFELAQLHEDKCWMLFKHCVFGNQEENEYADLLEIGRRIVKKCNGLPLAIKVLGGLLGYETSEEKWKEVLEIDTWKTNEIIPTLSLSYHHMPLHLRPCFLYLSMFPKDKEFRKERVIRLWMAQGYINSRPNKTLEDIGGEYFEELRCRSLIDSLHQGIYLLHDLIHDLARSINEKIYPKSTNDKLSDGSFHVHHLYLNEQNELLNYITTSNAMSLRTLWDYNLDDISAISSGSDDLQIHSPIIFLTVSLRVLKLEACIFALPDDIGILKHLRYLSISGEKLEYLSEELCLLYNLQTLEAFCHTLCELPSDIGNLINLRCLVLYSQNLKKLPDSISYLCNLQILDLDAFSMDELPSGIEQLTNLRRLKLSCSRSGIEIPRGLGKLTRLQTIEGTLNFKGDAIQGGLGEFKLIDLRGYLCIEGIENITDMEYTRQANFKSKSNLECLWLNFRNGYYDDDDNDHPKLHLIINKPISMRHSTCMKDIQESVLDSLQPHGNIKNLKILNYGGTKWPSWISDPLQMSKLTHLCLVCYSGYKCMCLPSLGGLSSLKFLSIRGLDVEKIESEFCRESNSSSNNAFPSLEKLVFSEMLKWEDWVGVLDGDFPSLKELSIKWCPNLLKLPTIRNELEKLEICACGFHEIQLPVSLYMENVKISYCRELTLVIGLNNYKSLEELTIQHCPFLKISMDSLLLSMITKVCIRYCAKLDIPGMENIDYYQKNATDKWFRADSNNVQFPKCAFSLVCTNEALGTHLHEGMTSQKCVKLDLPILEELEIGKRISSHAYYYYDGDNKSYNLKRLFILGLPKLCHCKWDFMPITIEYLEVSRCHELITIPPLGEDSALREIRISGCPKFSVIVGLHLLSSLKTLILEDCQELRVLPCEKLKIGIQTVQISNCPLTMDWCQLNGFPENKEIRFLTDGEGSSNMVHSTKDYLTDGIGASIMAESAKADVEEDLDTSLHLSIIRTHN
ncbi:hypothetical protein LUZ60_017095 [Juncus effusus]|nr:hypothetical protein LUZ60_017095 [Juncus effusus]